ncbi:MAG: hypothetical protein HON05_00505 [Euryarchaeota archaeon]|jgi:hypothetical protein|nr:hypothetical protein [Euryarchaeota archaeon]MBT5025226.1 hypothetical protein [Euryarchaeota archaeon]MBT6255488.1 hypothetical protein [Euryarchaeota archaeon]MBT6527056.1 hypothetical protein [Euryarchaeota archaeon]MBT7961839.1 hypothetical protein [Euryarchaeota archaeon]
MGAPSPSIMTNLLNRSLDLMCWTAAAPLVRHLRVRQLQKQTQEQRDIHRISRLLNRILVAHSDMLS